MLTIIISVLLCVELLLVTSCNSYSMDGPKNDAIGTVEPYISFPTGTEYMGQIKDKIVCIDGTSKDLIIADTSGTITSTKIAPQDVIIMGEVICAEDHDGNYHYFDADGNKLDSTEYAEPDCLLYLDNTLNKAKGKNGLWGYVDKNGRWIMEPNYIYATDFNDGFAYVEMNHGIDCGIIDTNGTFIELEVAGYPPEKSTFHDSRLLLHLIHDTDERRTYSTFVTSNGDVLPSEFESRVYEHYPYGEAFDFSCGLAVVQVNGGKWGYIDVDGNCVIEPKFYRAYPFIDNYAIVELDEDIFSMIDIDGKQIYDPIKMEGYSSTGEFANGLFEVVDSTWKSNLASFTGEILLQSSVYVLDYKYPVWETENGCYIPMNDEFVSGYLTDVYNNSFTIDNGLSCSLYDINTGKILLVLPKIFPFSEGYAKAQNEDGYWGYINSRGEWVIPAQFESASDIKNGVGFVDTGERCGLIKLSG